MKVETMVALSEDLVEELESRAQSPSDPSAIIEAALRAYLARPRTGDDAGDLEIINARSAELNEEAADVLEHQVIPCSANRQRAASVRKRLPYRRKTSSRRGLS